MTQCFHCSYSLRYRLTLFKRWLAGRATKVLWRPLLAVAVGGRRDHHTAAAARRSQLHGLHVGRPGGEPRGRPAHEVRMCLHRKASLAIYGTDTWEKSCVPDSVVDPDPLSFWQSWIRIRLHLTVTDPDLYWECWSKIHEHGNWPKLTNKPGFLPFKKAFVPS